MPKMKKGQTGASGGKTAVLGKKTGRPKKGEREGMPAAGSRKKGESGAARTETIYFQIASGDKARLRKAAKNDRPLTQFILDALGTRIRSGDNEGERSEKIKRGSSDRKDDKVLLLIPTAAKNRLRRFAKKADLNLSQYILDTLFE